MRQTGKTKGTKRERNGGWKWKKISQAGPVNCSGLETDGQPQWRYLRRPWKSFWFEEGNLKRTAADRRDHRERERESSLGWMWWGGGEKCVLEGGDGIWGFDPGEKKRKKKTSFDIGELWGVVTSVSENWTFLPQKSTTEKSLKACKCNGSNFSSLSFQSIICQESQNKVVGEKV